MVDPDGPKDHGAMTPTVGALASWLIQRLRAETRQARETEERLRRVLVLASYGYRRPSTSSVLTRCGRRATNGARHVRGLPFGERPSTSRQIKAPATRMSAFSPTQNDVR